MTAIFAFSQDCSTLSNTNEMADFRLMSSSTRSIACRQVGLRIVLHFSVPLSGPAIHQALQTGFDTAATDERCVDLGCLC
jgi:hypothetical protein